MDYKTSGVDIEAGYRSVDLIKKHVQSTFSKNVLTGLGGFGGLFSLSMAKDMEEPCLVSGTDGVGTKLKIAFLKDKHDTIGIDCVAMCANDIVCCGATPLFFLDYIACGKNIPERIEEIVKGVAAGCKMADLSLIGGETAEMPGFYPENEYDIAGFAVGIVDKKNIIDGSRIKEDDVLIGITSSGLHSNGFSLVRKVLRPSENNINEFITSIGAVLGEELLKPTKIYVRPVNELLKKVNVKGISNITGGGFYENIPRMFPKGIGAEIKEDSFPKLPVFNLIKQLGEIKDEVMYNTFNMGIGLVIAVDKEETELTLEALKEAGEQAYVIGKTIKGEGVIIC